MNQEEFNKGIKEFRAVSLSGAEKKAMLDGVFQTPVESPFMNWEEVFGFFKKPMMAGYVLASFMLTLTSVAYTAEMSAPGDALYAVKTAVFEPIQDQIRISPVEQLEWEAEKIERRIAEAEALSKDNKLDDKKTEEIERKIKKSSSAYAVAAQKVASSTATTTEGRALKAKELKDSVRKKLEDKEENRKEEEREDKEKIKRLKNRAVEALDEEDEDGKERGEGSGKRGKDRD